MALHYKNVRNKITLCLCDFYITYRIAFKLEENLSLSFKIHAGTAVEPHKEICNMSLAKKAHCNFNIAHSR